MFFAACLFVAFCRGRAAARLSVRQPAVVCSFHRDLTGDTSYDFPTSHTICPRVPTIHAYTPIPQVLGSVDDARALQPLHQKPVARPTPSPRVHRDGLY